MIQTDKKPIEADREILIERIQNLGDELLDSNFMLAAQKVLEVAEILRKTRPPK